MEAAELGMAGARQSRGLTIEFTDLKFKAAEKVILNGVSGRFRPGHLSAVMGPSGAGKTSLLNILSGFMSSSLVEGSITVDGEPRDLTKLRQQSCYITQEFSMLNYLSVRETMHIAASLKLGPSIGNEKKKIVVDEVAATLGLVGVMESRVHLLSGGEKKRLSIGLELVSNPPIMFCDEPTSGLDSFSSLQVMARLQKLAHDGRTIIVVIHSPSSRLLELIDDLLLLAEGRSIYNGNLHDLLPTLESIGLQCPQYYNRADFALEVACKERGDHIQELTALAYEKHQKRIGSFYKDPLPSATNHDLAKAFDLVDHGKLLKKLEIIELGQVLTVAHCRIVDFAYVQSLLQYGLLAWGGASSCTLEPLVITQRAIIKTCYGRTNVFTLTTGKDEIAAVTYKQENNISKSELSLVSRDNEPSHTTRSSPYAAPKFNQFCILVKRSVVCNIRDLKLAFLRIIASCMVGLLIGAVYYDFGQDGAKLPSNFSCIFFIVMFHFYATSLHAVLLYPQEASVIVREHFNNWYALSMYYLAKLLAEMPLLILSPTLFVAISYYLTDQPMVWDRFLLFLLVNIILTILAQGVGCAFGVAFNPQVGIFLMTTCTMPMFLISGFFIHLDDLSPYVKWLSYISIFRYALEAASYSIFGFNREPLECSEEFCPYNEPEKFLKDMGFEHCTYWDNVLILCLFVLVSQVALFTTLTIRIAKSKER